MSLLDGILTGRAVRNFRIVGTIGHHHIGLGSGPDPKGEINLTIIMRSEGRSFEAIHILGDAAPDGRLILRARKINAHGSLQVETMRDPPAPKHD